MGPGSHPAVISTKPWMVLDRPGTPGANVEPEGSAPQGVPVHVACERQEDARLLSDEGPDLPRERGHCEAAAVVLKAIPRAPSGEERCISEAEESHRDGVVDGTLCDPLDNEAPRRCLEAARQQHPSARCADAGTEVLVFEKGQRLVEAAKLVEPLGVDQQSLVSVDGLWAAEGRQALVVGERRPLCIVEPKLEVTGEWAGLVLAGCLEGMHCACELAGSGEAGVGVEEQQQGSAGHRSPGIQLPPTPPGGLDEHSAGCVHDLLCAIGRAAICHHHLEIESALTGELVDQVSEVGRLVERRHDHRESGQGDISSGWVWRLSDGLLRLRA